METLLGVGVLLGLCLWMDWRHGRKLDRLTTLVQTLTAREQAEGVTIMAIQEDLTELKADVLANTDAINAMGAVLDFNTEQLDKLVAGGSIDPADVQALSTALKSSKAQILANIAKNTRLDTRAQP